MTQSNTKLNATQKADLKDLKKLWPEAQIYSFPELGVTIANRPCQEYIGKTPNMMEVAFSFMSPDEKKFRAKVGEYHARGNLAYGSSTEVPLTTDLSALARSVRTL